MLSCSHWRAVWHAGLNKDVISKEKLPIWKWKPFNLKNTAKAIELSWSY